MKKGNTEVFLITPLWNFLSPASGVITQAKYEQLMRIVNRFCNMLKRRGYEVSSVAQMADLSGFSDYELLTALRDSSYTESLMANVWAQIDNCEIVTTIPVNIMADEFVASIKKEYLDRYVSISQLLKISDQEIARLVQISLNTARNRNKKITKKSRRPNKPALQVKKTKTLADSVSPRGE